VQTATSLPSVLFALVGGALADMFDRRQVLMSAQVIMLLSAMLLAALQAAGLMDVWPLLGLTFLLNIGTALRMPAQSALANDLVVATEVPAAVALSGISSNVGRTIGPGIGGLLVAAAGAQAAFLTNAACIAAAIGSTLTWRTPPRDHPRQRMHLGRAMLEGLAYGYANRNIRILLIRVFCWVFCAVGLWGLMPMIAKYALGGGPFDFGLMLACLGIGALGGAALMARWYEKSGVESILRITTVVFAVIMVATATLHSLILLAPFLLVGGAVWIVFMTTPAAAIQLLAPAPIRGRIVAVHFMVLYGGYGLGSWFWGLVADCTGLGTSLLIAAALLLGNLILAGFMPYRPGPDSPLP
jgi:predicted MFS family arabinose efflux permease